MQRVTDSIGYPFGLLAARCEVAHSFDTATKVFNRDLPILTTSDRLYPISNRQEAHNP